MAMARAGFEVHFERMYVAPITIVLKRMGVKPEGEKILSPFKIPWKNAAMEMTTK